MSVVKKYLAEVVSVENRAENIYTVAFSANGQKFRYLPGQFLHLALDPFDPSEAWPESRCFSIQTNPSEGNLKITFSVKGNFTQRMADELQPGRKTWLKLPYGELFSGGFSKNQTVFIAGGTGITPYLSLFTNAGFAEYSRPKLYAGFRNQVFDIYHEELEIARQINPLMTIVKFYEDKDGIVDIARIFAENGVEPAYFISGPPAMIKIFSSFLKNNGVAENKVVTDEWE
jgi:ferredoxin-NADP reductase